MDQDKYLMSGQGTTFPETKGISSLVQWPAKNKQVEAMHYLWQSPAGRVRLTSQDLVSSPSWPLWVSEIVNTPFSNPLSFEIADAIRDRGLPLIVAMTALSRVPDTGAGRDPYLFALMVSMLNTYLKYNSSGQDIMNIVNVSKWFASVTGDPVPDDASRKLIMAIWDTRFERERICDVIEQVTNEPPSPSGETDYALSRVVANLSVGMGGLVVAQCTLALDSSNAANTPLFDIVSEERYPMTRDALYSIIARMVSDTAAVEEMEDYFV